MSFQMLTYKNSKASGAEVLEYILIPYTTTTLPIWNRHLLHVYPSTHVGEELVGMMEFLSLNLILSRHT